MPEISISEPHRSLFFIGPPARLFTALMHGVKIAAAVSAALYAAFFLQLDQPSWAGVTAAIVAQPVLGAVFRKGVFRLAGTIAGAVAAVILVIAFPQSRAGFFIGLAFWEALCAYAATAMRNFGAYGAFIGGLTAAVVALDSIATPDHVLSIAISRASEIILGIVSVTLVFSLTDFGRARDDLANRMGHIGEEIMAALIKALRVQSGPIESSRAARRALLAEVAALDGVIDAAIGESLPVRAHAATLQDALAGLFSAMSSWRIIEAHLSEHPGPAAEAGAAAALSALSAAAIPAALTVEAGRNPAMLRDRLQSAAGSFLDIPAAGPSARLLLDQTGKALRGLAQTMNGIALLRAPSTAAGIAARAIGRTHDPLRASLNSLRVAFVIAAAVLFWIFSQWPNGPMFIIFAVYVSLRYNTQRDQAFDMGLAVLLSSMLAAASAGVLKFFLLPSQESYVAFTLLLGAFLVPGGALAAFQGGLGTMALFYSAYLIAMLNPANQMVYDLGDFLNNVLAIAGGSIAGITGYRLIPPLSPALRARRHVAAALRDLQRLAAGRWSPSAETWEIRLYDRLIALPATSTPLQRGQLATALGVGLAILPLRALAQAAGEQEGVQRMLTALAAGDFERARADAAEIAGRLAAMANSSGDIEMQRFRVCLLEIEDAVATHPEYFSRRG
ncbi:MAG: FUSC family protein [Beijerinckiaceae bacterium]|nr:FUSC family protein [Beijerinckiaceae bacterium]